MESLTDPDPPGSAREILHRSLVEILRFLLCPAQVALTRLAVSEATAAPEVARLFYDNAMGGLSAAFTRRIAGLAAQGRIRCSDADWLGSSLVGCALNRQLLRRLTHPEAGPPDVAELERRVSALLDPRRAVSRLRGLREPVAERARTAGAFISANIEQDR